MVEFPEAVRELRLRRDGEYDVCGVIRGDGAEYMRREFDTPLPPVYVIEVSELSGFAKGRISCGTCGGEGVLDSGGSTPWGEWINIPCPDCE